jgi:Alpha/beta hydrolase of unknown function (DUF900)
MMSVFVLDFRLNDVDGPVVPGKLTLATPTMDTLQACQNVVFMVHGFNVSRPDGSAELQKLGSLLTSVADGAAVAVLWPGDSKVGPASYPFETNNADDTSVELAKFIHDNLSQGTRISFVSHSLGARVVLQTIEQLRIMEIPVYQVCLMAGAVDNDCLASIAEFRAATLYALRTAVLYSPCNHVLEYAYPAGNLLSAFIHWTATTDAALGFTGPKAASGPSQNIPSQVQATGIPTQDAVDHGDYLPNANSDPSQKQLAAARYVNLVVGGSSTLTYSYP